MTEIFSLTANLLMIAVMTVYIWRLVRGHTTLNTATWMITIVVMTLNTLTYAAVVQWKLEEVAITIIVWFGVATIFFYSLIKGKFAKVGALDIVALVVTILIGIVWQTTGNAVLANVALQSILLISFMPTVVGLIRRKLRDHPLPWLLAVVSYMFQILTVLGDADGWNWAELVFPTVNGIFGNGSVALAVIWQHHTAPALVDEAVE